MKAMKKFFLDFETRSTLDIKKVGAWKYAAHPSTEIMCLGIAFEGQTTPPRILLPKDLTRPQQLDGFQLVAHSAHFEYAIYHFILHKRFGWPELSDPKRWDCTLARAAMCNLPISLGHLGAALGLKVQKDLKGRAALMKLCKPFDYDPLSGVPVYNEDPELYAQLYPYCGLDVETEIAADARLPEMPPMERAIFEHDLIINRRGVEVDVPLAINASAIAKELTNELNAKLVQLTDGAVSKASRIAEMKRYLATQGLANLESLDKAAVNTLLARADVSQIVKDVVGIRRQVGKSSTAKYAAIVNAANETDNRVRGALQYHAAGTGRWGGRLIQPQNFPKGLGKKEQSMAIEAILSGDAQLFSLLYGDGAMDTLSGALRGAIKASEGKTLVVADYSAIESRVVLWLANDTLALNKYRTGVNLYVDMAKFIYQRSEISKEGTPQEYAVGKAAVLGCGYGMGKDKFHATCVSWGINISPELAAKAVQAYREKYKTVVQMWYAVEAAARAAVKTPGSTHAACGGKVIWGMDQKREFLACRLPSGRYLRYYRPSIRAVESPFGGEKETIFYWAAGFNGALEEYKTYGGSLVENITQAVARDLMAAGMQNCEAAGYPIVLTVHDELVAETEQGFGSVEEFVKLMCETPAWASGCPIAAEGWAGTRYRK